MQRHDTRHVVLRRDGLRRALLSRGRRVDLAQLIPKDSDLEKHHQIYEALRENFMKIMSSKSALKAVLLLPSFF